MLLCHQENFNSMMALDGKTKLEMASFQAPKIRLLRSLSIEESEGMQVLFSNISVVHVLLCCPLWSLIPSC